MLHPNVVLRFIDEVIGYGVFATRTIPRGTITWAQDAFDQVYRPNQVARLPARNRAILERYGYLDATGSYVLCWDFGRFMNHSCEPSTCTGGATFDIALREIPAGDELTYNYVSLNITTPFDCRCGSPCCRSLICPDPHWRKDPAWQAAVSGGLPLIGAVPQPLEDLVEEADVVQAFLDQGLSVPPAVTAMNWKRPPAAETAPSEEPSLLNSPWTRPRP